MASIVPVFVPHAGCPCRCVFCNQRTIAGQSARMMPDRARDILTQALSVLPDGSAPQAAFYGGSFTAIPVEEQEALLAVTDAFLAQGRLSAVRLSTRPDAIDEAILDRLRRHGVATIELGAQSMDDEVLRLSQRGHTAADTVRASRLIRQAGISLILQTMAGLPGDTRETVRQTAESVAALEPDGVRIYPVAVLPDTGLHELWQAGSYTPLDNETAAVWCADMLEVFQRADIPVIRIGLNPTEELDRTVEAGAYHPAFRELCEGEIYLEKMLFELSQKSRENEYVIEVPEKSLSKAKGQSKRNEKALKNQGK